MTSQGPQYHESSRNAIFTPQAIPKQLEGDSGAVLTRDDVFPCFAGLCLGRQCVLG